MKTERKSKVRIIKRTYVTGNFIMFTQKKVLFWWRTINHYNSISDAKSSFEYQTSFAVQSEDLLK